jgi:hypothetical protein
VIWNDDGTPIANELKRRIVTPKFGSTTIRVPTVPVRMAPPQRFDTRGAEPIPARYMKQLLAQVEGEDD